MKQWPQHKAYFWETAPFFRALLPFIAGILCYDLSGFWRVPVAWFLYPLFIAAVLYIVSAFRKWPDAIRFTSLHIGLFLCAWALCYSNDVRNDKYWFRRQSRDAEAAIAVITKGPLEKDRTYKLELDVISMLSGDTAKYSMGKAFAYVYKDDTPLSLHTGDTIIIPGKWQLIKNSSNPFEFDYSRYCARNNIYYQQFIAANELTIYGKASPAKQPYTTRMHDACMRILQEHISDCTTLGIIQAMLIGDEANFDPELRQAYSETGIIHVIAISGSHITFFFVFISFLLGWIRKKKWHWIKYAIALPLIWFYVVMAGAPPSAIRAAAMFTLLAIGFMLGKRSNSLNQLFATAFLLLCAEPMWLFSVGFRLSFVAVLSLILLYTPIYSLYKPSNKVMRLLWASISASVAAEILVAPLVVYYFHIFPLHFLLANIVAYVFMGFIMLLGMLIIALHTIAPLANILAILAVWLTTVFNHIISFFRQLNPESFSFLQLSGLETVLLYIFISCAAVWFICKQKPAIFIGLPALIAFVSLLCIDQWKALHQQRLVVYNLNRGSHIEYISGKYHEIVYTDTLTDAKKKGYAVKPAHTAWLAWRSASAQRRELMQIGNQAVLLLDKPPAGSDTLQVDHVIINYPAKFPDIETIQQQLRPKRIIISGQLSRRQAESYKTQALEKHIPLHITMNDGAYIIDGSK